MASWPETAGRAVSKALKPEQLLIAVTGMVAGDGPCVAPYGVTGQGKPHPRLYGTFPRLIGHYTRDLGLLTLP